MRDDHSLPDTPDRARRWRGYFSWVGKLEFGVLVMFLVVTAGLWGFVELADEVAEGDTHALDERILLSMRAPDDPSDPAGPLWVEEMARDFTALGGLGLLVLVTLSAAAYLAMRGKGRTTLFLIAAVGGGWAIGMLLKGGFDRPRPDLVPHASHVYTTSFPSGHSMMAAVTWLTLAALVARTEKRVAVKLFLLGLAALVTVAVGVSRIYVGVHWPTDVLAGWTAGAVWASLCWLAARWLQRHGTVEPEELETPRESG